MFQTYESCYNQWVSDHYRVLIRSAWAMTGSRAVAEDVVQDCFTSAWKRCGHLRQPEMACPWLFQIMRRNALRHMVPGPQSRDDSEEAASKPAAPSGIDDRRDVVKALTRIAPIHREVLVLYYFDDISTARMAEALEVAPDTVLSRLARARDALRAAMAPASAAFGASDPTALVASNVTELRKT
jgi:RNA polymerase sigma factor (sigma-70 family)